MGEQPPHYLVGHTSDGQPVYASSSPKTNGMAVATLVLSLILGFVAIPFGHVAKAQIRRTGEQGSGLAKAGLTLGYLYLVVAIAAGSMLAWDAHTATSPTPKMPSCAELYGALNCLGSKPSPGSFTTRAYPSQTYPATSYPAPAKPAPDPSVTPTHTDPSVGWSQVYRDVTPPVSGADWQGFITDTGARCHANDPALVIASNAQSKVVICLTQDTRFYYLGTRTSDGASVEVADPQPGMGSFAATSHGTTYTVNSQGLRISAPPSAPTTKTWDSYWRSRYS